MSATRSRSGRFLVLVSLAFLVGLATVVIQGNGSSDDPGDGAPPGVRRTILILGVDDLQAEDPRLVALWQATFLLDQRELFVLGYPTDKQVCVPNARPLNELFEWSSDRGVHPEFMAAFDGQELLTPQVIIVADEVAFAWLIDWREGIELGDAQLDGQQALAVLRPLYGNPAGALAMQEAFVLSLKEKVPSLGEETPIDKIADLMPDHLYMSHSIQDVLVFLSPLIPPDTIPILVYAIPDSGIDCSAQQ